MADSLNNIKANGKLLAKAGAALLYDELQFCKSINQADPSDYKGKNGFAAGDTIDISIPWTPTVDTSFDITSQIQDIKERKVSLALDTPLSVSFDLDTQQLAHDIDVKSVFDRAVAPSIRSLASKIEQTFLQSATQATFNLVGTAGSTVYDTDTILSAREKMNKFLCPKDNNRFFLTDSTASRSAVNARKGLFQSSSEIADQYKMGFIGIADGFKWMENELLYSHTNGTDVTGIAVESTVLAPATGASTLGVDGVATGATVKKGQVFTIADVYAVHPLTKVSTGVLQQFVVTADATEDGGNTLTLSISPTIYSSSSGALQNVSALPVDEAAITFVGSASTAYNQSLAFHKDAFTMVSVPLQMPTSTELASQETYKGFTIALIRDFDVLQRRWITRLDFLGGIVAPRPEWACRVTA